MPPTGVEFSAPLVSTLPNDSRAAAEVVELSLLLPRWQVIALESAARQQGITTGQMIRRAIAQMIPDEASM